MHYRQEIAVVVLLLSPLHDVLGFQASTWTLINPVQLSIGVIPQRHSSLRLGNALALRAVRSNKNKGGTGNARGTKKSQQTASNSKRSGSTKAGAARSTGVPSNSSAKALSSPRVKTTPPWQVMSDKEVKAHVTTEIARRAAIENGRQKSHEGSTHIATPTLSSQFLTPHQRSLMRWKRFASHTVASVQHVGSYLDGHQVPALGVPVVTFLGRSNVGKSSLLNALSGRKDSQAAAARVGKTPGATASVNLYTLHDAHDRVVLGWADLPGFGYAKLSRERQERVQQAAEQYLGRHDSLGVMLGLLLVDLRRKPSAEDQAVLAALYDLGLPLVVVATKADKVSNHHAREQCRATIRNSLGLPENQPLCVSTVTGEGCAALWQIVLDACGEGVADARRQYVDEGATKMLEADKIPVEDFVDNDDLVYSQGYDWVQDQVMDERWGMENDDDDDDVDTDIEFSTRKETFSEIRQRADDMQERGEL